MKDVLCSDAVGILVEICDEIGTENSIAEAKEVYIEIK
jgi:hypothetical protein